MPFPSRPTTIRVLATLAGVSPATVSLALRDSPEVSEAVRRRLQRLAAKHGYVVDGRVKELMTAIRRHGAAAPVSALAVMSLYPEAEPWRRHRIMQPMLAGIRAKTEALGYRLEPFWAKAPKMTYARLRAILEARGIRGIVSLGSSVMDEPWPDELADFAVVTLGYSIRSRLHRVASHVTHNAHAFFSRLHALGYRRPALLLHQPSDGRNQHIFAATALYYARYVFRQREPAILYLDAFDPAAFGAWFDRHRPDAVVFHDHERYQAGVEAFLRQRRLRVPRDIGVGGLDGVFPPPRLSGIRQNYLQIGVSAVEMLVARLQQQDFRLPTIPKVELVEGDWNAGETLRPAPPRAADLNDKLQPD